ncbi:hypothetical protein FPOAC2_05899 [Fusarium poae]
MSAECFCDLYSGRDRPSAPSFTLFTQLPSEIRLLIWKAALPQHQDLHTAYNIWASDHKRWKSIRLRGKQEAPVGLLRACFESRDVALETGSFLELSHAARFMIPLPAFEPIWIDNSIKTLMMPINPQAFRKINCFPKNIQSIATLATMSAGKMWIRKAFEFLVSTKHCHNIKTILAGLMWIPLAYSEGSNKETHPCVDSETVAVSLDDPKMIDYLTSAFESHAIKVLGKQISPACYRKSARDFLAFIKNRERRFYSWDHDLVPDGFELKAAIIFGRPHSFGCYDLPLSLNMMDSFVSTGRLYEMIPPLDRDTIRGLIEQ